MNIIQFLQKFLYFFLFFVIEAVWSISWNLGYKFYRINSFEVLLPCTMHTLLLGDRIMTEISSHFVNGESSLDLYTLKLLQESMNVSKYCPSFVHSVYFRHNMRSRWHWLQFSKKIKNDFLDTCHNSNSSHFLRQ